MKFVAVDCGKYETKVAICESEKKRYKEFKFRTKMDAGRFDDDMLGRSTYIAQIDGGAVLRIGADATVETKKVTSKSDEIHKSATLLALALAANEGETEDLVVAIGIPYSICADVEARNKYKDFILPEGMTHTVTYKKSATSQPVTVSFNVSKRYVYPESIGAMYEYPEYFQDVSGIIDIGNVNRGGTYINTRAITHGFSFTDEHGGQDLISSLANKLTVELGSRCTYDLAAKTLKKNKDERYLISKNGDPTVQEKSKAIIDAHLMEYANSIKELCDTKTWSLDFMDILAIGGTSALIKDELKAVFGNGIYIPEQSEMVNARGFLGKVCADNDIDLEAIKKAERDKKNKEKKGAA